MFLRATRAAELFAGRSAAWHSIAAIAAVAGLLLTGQAAQADCTPASGNNVTASCTGTTINQAGGAPGTSAGSDGYGTGTETGLNVTVVPDASVAGTNSGIIFSTGTVINSGSISGGSFGIVANTATVTNSGTISGGSAGINANTATVTNSGTISGGTYGIFAGTTATVTNSSTISGGGNGIFAGTTAIVTNSGTISGGGFGIRTNGTATVTNFGSISGLIGVRAITATVTNSGTISGGVSGVGIGANIANVTNSGSISGGNSGISGVTATVANSGSISGGTGITLTGGAGSTLVNSGTIIGTGGNAIDFSLSNSDSLTFLPGTRITGAILLGANDNVSVVTGRDVSSLTTFTPNGPFTLTAGGSAPFVVVGNQIAVVDPTAFGMADKTLMDFTGFISSLLGGRFGEFSLVGTTPTAFAPTYNPIVDGANAAIGNALAYAGDSRVPNATSLDRASGIAVWSKGFVGGRSQSADGPNLGATAIAYGGAMGLDKQFTSALRLGAFVGAGNSRLNVDLGSQTVKTDYVFGGVYGRYNWTAQFFDFAVTGGNMANSSNRTVADNINGLQTASANYNGWFVSPELATGIHIPQGTNIVMTPAARLRYLVGGLGSYSETGTAQNLAVASRTMQDIEERFEVAIERIDPLKVGILKSTATIGVLGQERLGSTAINTILIGQNLSFAATGQNNVGGAYVGLGFDYRMSQMMSLFTKVEGTVMTGNSVTGVAQAGVRVLLN